MNYMNYINFNPSIKKSKIFGIIIIGVAILLTVAFTALVVAEIEVVAIQLNDGINNVLSSFLGEEDVQQIVYELKLAEMQGSNINEKLYYIFSEGSDSQKESAKAMLIDYTKTVKSNNQLRVDDNRLLEIQNKQMTLKDIVNSLYQ